MKFECGKKPDIAQYKGKYNSPHESILYTDSKWWSETRLKIILKEIGLVKENILEKIKLKHHLTGCKYILSR